ncbi:MAG: 23S rRNA (guanosine(2251)-2'-O)-methyltransferase RlmB, partial [Pseudomonadota bacterium]
MAAPTKKPKWAIERDRQRRAGPDRVWLFGLHAVRDALENPLRIRHRLIVTPNAEHKLSGAIQAAAITPEIS